MAQLAPRRLAALLGLAVGAVVLLPLPATGAACAPPPPLSRGIEEADIVFVGTVTDTRNHSYWATVEVEELWQGDDIPTEVEVRGRAKGPHAHLISSEDRSFRVGVRYLILPTSGRGSIFNDNLCTSTQPYKDGLERYRPPDAQVISGGGSGQAASPAISSDRTGLLGGPMLFVAAALIAALAAVLAARRSDT
jgi:hypothetical protein